MGVPYELQANGTQILVPSERVLGLRMAMAEDGLPGSASVGYEIFDRAGQQIGPGGRMPLVGAHADFR